MTEVNLRIETNTGSVRATIPAQLGTYTREFRAQARGEIVIPRGDWRAISDSIDDINDKFFIEVEGTDEFAGRLDDTESSPQTVSIRLNSPEIDAAEAEPTGENVVYENVADSTILTDNISNIPTISAGTIDTLKNSISYTVSYASRSKVFYDLRQITGGEFVYNPDFTVDYKAQIGTDKSLVLGPEEENIGLDFQKKRDVREEVTHLRALGAEQGPNQVTTTAVADSYSGGRKIWKRYTNKEVIQKSRLQDIADELVNEYDGEPRFLEVEATVYGEDIQLGDTVIVDYPDENINSERLEAIRVQTGYEPNRVYQRVTLSNRSLTQEGSWQKRNDDVERFNDGYQGFVDRAQAGGDGRQPVDTNLNSNATVFYPDDVEEEITARVLVEGLAYRSYSSGGETNVQFDEELADIGTYGNSVVVDDPSQWFTLATISPSDGAVSQMVTLQSSIRLFNRDISTTENVQARLIINGSANRNEYFFGDMMEVEPDGFDAGGSVSITLPGDYRNDISSIELQAKAPSIQTDESLELTSFLTGIFHDTHTHPPDPGVSENFDGTSYYPSNCDVLVNGTSMGVSLGDGTGTFNEFVDISGELTPGVNSVEVTSDTLGHIRSTVETELFRRGKSS